VQIAAQAISKSVPEHSIMTKYRNDRLTGTTDRVLPPSRLVRSSSLAFALCLTVFGTGTALAKLPAPSDEAKAKAAEAAALTAHNGKVANFQLCKSMDKVSDRYRADAKKAGKSLAAVPDGLACADPGPFVYTAPVPAAPPGAPIAAAAPGVGAPAALPAAPAAAPAPMPTGAALAPAGGSAAVGAGASAAKK
jgi:hypothetical protein